MEASPNCQPAQWGLALDAAEVRPSSQVVLDHELLGQALELAGCSQVVKRRGTEMPELADCSQVGSA